MDAQQFAYWLQGYAELSGDEPPTVRQWKAIRDHLNLVFLKVTPDRRAIKLSPWVGPHTPGLDLKPLEAWCCVSVNDGLGTTVLC